MSDEKFDVVFFGILQTGKDKDTVMQNMAKLFKTDAEKLAPYFSGGRKVIKGKLNAESAEKYQGALENVGLVIKLETCKVAEQPTKTEAATSPAPPDTGDITVAPVGSDVIENPTKVQAQKIEDISSISMAVAGADVLENPVETPAQIIEDISDISLADVGANVIETPVVKQIQKIEELSDVTLAETGTDIIENPEPEIKVDVPDISELSLKDLDA